MLAALYGALFAQIYHYILYPGLLAALPKRRRKDGERDAPAKSVSVIVCAFNEAGMIADKIANIEALDPAPSEILVVTDGSSDGTDAVARRSGAGKVALKVFHQPERRGKAHAMNRAAALASSDILCFNDANTTLSRDALAHVLAEFRDDTVAIVSGAKHVTGSGTAADPAKSVATGDGAYWRYESFIRRQESLLGATVSVVGELMAIRKADWTDIPPGVVNDDAWMAMRILSAGRNVRYAPRAESWETATPNTRLEVERRRRINVGRMRLLARREAWPLDRPFVLLAFLSHKVLRLLLPLFFAISLATSVALAAMGGSHAPIALVIALLHGAAIAFAVLHVGLRAVGVKWKLASIAFHILSSYGSVFLALYDAARGKQHVLWSKPAR